MASHLVLQERLSDVILKIRHDGLSWRMPAHSLILASKSSKFQEILDDRTGEESPTSVPLVDMHPDTALSVLKYIYEDELPTTVTADLLVAAKNYRLETLYDILETRLKEDITVPQACQVLEELNVREPHNGECFVKKICFNMLETHALTVFGSDMIMCLSKKTLCALLESDRLNAPDDAYLFWGVWRWGRKHSSLNGRSLRDQDIAVYIDDLIVLIRKSSLKNKSGIPQFVYSRFNSCKCRRHLYVCPADILKQTNSIRTCPTWEDIVAPKMSEAEEGPVCIQLSVEKDVMLVGLSLEMCAYERSDSFVRVVREDDNLEVRRQKIEWHTSSTRRFSPRGDPESRVESEVTFHTPLFLIPGKIYSVQLLGKFNSCHFVWGSFRKRRVKAGDTFVLFHGHGVTAVREIYVIPDVSVTWGPRGVEI